MGHSLPGENPFVIDGTGRVVRVGDEVVVCPRRTLFASAGPATVTGIVGDSVGVHFPFDEDETLQPIEIFRADDHERTPHGDPLWCWA
jgi:hypothetical protein